MSVYKQITCINICLCYVLLHTACISIQQTFFFPQWNVEKCWQHTEVCDIIHVTICLAVFRLDTVFRVWLLLLLFWCIQNVQGFFCVHYPLCMKPPFSHHTCCTDLSVTGHFSKVKFFKNWLLRIIVNMHTL